MKFLAKQLDDLGIERRFALDIGSVIAGVRPRGLLHVSGVQQQGLERLLILSGLRVEASRKLYRGYDTTSREGILNERSFEATDETWCEVWYSSPKSMPIGHAELFGNPGKFLGYPQCCRRSLEGKDALSSLYQRYLFEDSDRHWEINRLAALFHNTILMPDFFPCSLTCASARNYIIPFHELAVDVFSKREFEEAKNAMRAPVTLIAGEIIQWLNWECNGEHLLVKASRAKKESISKVSSNLPRGDSSVALLVWFKHILVKEEKVLPRFMSIELNENDTISLPLKII